MDYPNCIKQALIDSQITQEARGFDMICDAIMVRYYNPDFDINYLDKIVYPSIAKKFKTTTSNVEKTIRYTIQIAYDRHNKLVEEITKNNKFEITNMNFIDTYEKCLHYQITEELKEAEGEALEPR